MDPFVFRQMFANFNNSFAIRLNLNQKLLSFKESKDIHGREAVFEKLENTSFPFIEMEILKRKFLQTNKLHSVNETWNATTNPMIDMSVNSEINFQIVLTTYPSNASYELTFKYNLHDGKFHFNKNELSRINRYNGTANCIVENRPDLRQFCYCK